MSTVTRLPSVDRGTGRRFFVFSTASDRPADHPSSSGYRGKAVAVQNKWSCTSTRHMALWRTQQFHFESASNVLGDQVKLLCDTAAVPGMINGTACIVPSTSGFPMCRLP